MSRIKARHEYKPVANRSRKSRLPAAYKPNSNISRASRLLRTPIFPNSIWRRLWHELHVRIKRLSIFQISTGIRANFSQHVTYRKLIFSGGGRGCQELSIGTSRVWVAFIVLELSYFRRGVLDFIRPHWTANLNRGSCLSKIF